MPEQSMNFIFSQFIALLMLKYGQLILSIALLASYCLALNVPFSTSTGTLPPLGTFINPFVGFWQNAESVQFEDEEISKLPLHSGVEIVFDDRLVPHIFGANQEDILFAQGYLHARFRLWQMDISTRKAAGRLAEVFGKRLVDLDRQMRRMGVPMVAHRYAEGWKKCDSYPLLQAYVEGVNFYIDQLQTSNLPIEFKLFNYQPERWSDYHTALIMMSMNLALCSRNEDIAASNTRQLLGEEMFEFYFPFHNPHQSPVIPTEVTYDFEPLIPSVGRAILKQGAIPNRFNNTTHRHVGSNNWAVSGSHTASGHPILCNDPHLDLTLPSIWYEMQLQGDDRNSYGVTLPGVPHIIIGFNEDVAWGQTNVGIDVSDLYEINWVDKQQGIYRLDDQELRTLDQIDTIHVKGESPIIDTIRYTTWGPIYIDDSISLALKWLPAYHAGNDCILNTFANLNKAKNVEDYLGAISDFSNPAQNFVFASRSGDVAIRVQGTIPVRDGAGRFVLAGDDSRNDWHGFVPTGQNPMVINPERGFVSSANQHSTDSTYPYNYHGYFDDYRGRTLNQYLSNMHDVTVQDMKALQLNDFSILAAELCPLLLSMLDSSTYHDDPWYQTLSGWDHHFRAAAKAPVFFEKWHEIFEKLTWDEINTNSDLELLTPETWRLIDILAEDPRHPCFDLLGTPSHETAEHVAEKSFQRARQYCDSLEVPGVIMDWQSYKRVGVNHLSRIPAFSTQNIPVGGTASALNSIKETHGPSWRMVVELDTEEIKAWGIYPGGQSGNPGSPYYNNMIQDWALGNYYPLHFVHAPADIRSMQTFALKLSP